LVDVLRGFVVHERRPLRPSDGRRQLCDCEDMTGLPDKPDPELDADAYKVTIEVDPAEDEAYTIDHANSSNKPAVKAWGEPVGSLAESAVEPEGSQS
jgi:hypothetical protein